MQRRCLAVMLAALALTAADSPRPARQSPAAVTRIEPCLLSIKQQVEVPAQEAGVLLNLDVQEGGDVAADQLIGQIDDSQRRMQKRLALIEQQAAREQADNDIEVRYARAAADVAKAEYQQAADANDKVTGTYPDAEIRRRRLAWHRAELQIEQAQLDRRSAHFTTQSRAAEVEAAEDNIRRRQIRSPLAGTVVSLYKNPGEWVSPGEAVLKIVRFDTLRVEGFVSARDFDPGEIVDKEVAVEVEVARGRRVQRQGKIVYVSSLVQAGGKYRIWAEVENLRENGQWLLRPGLHAAMELR